MLRSIRPNATIAHILRWEGILIDPIGAILSVLVYEVILASTDASMGHTILTLGKIVLIGLTLGLAAGQLLGELMRRHWLPDYLHYVFALSLVCGVFAVAVLLQGESGLLAVTVMGMRLANMQNVNTDRRETSFRQRAQLLFSQDLTYVKLASLLSQEWEIRTTGLTDHFGWEDYREAWGERALPLMAISPQWQLHPFAESSRISPAADWQVISIVKDVEKPTNEDG